MIAQTLTLVDGRLMGTNTSSTHFAPTIPTVLICDSPLLRSGLQHILRDTLFEIAEALSVTGPKRRQYCAPNTALVIIEATQNTGRVLEVIRQVREQSPETRIVALADQFDLGFVRVAHEAGLNGLCLTASGPDILIKALELVMLGEGVLPFEVVRSMMERAPQVHNQPVQDDCVAASKVSDLTACKLSAREAEILGCLTKGEPNKVIARRLDITEATIKVHVKAILRKIGATNRTQAAMWASQRLPQRGGAPANS